MDIPVSENDKLPAGAFILTNGNSSVGGINGKIIGPSDPETIRRELWKIANRKES